MDPKLAFWTFAWLDLGVVLACAALGVRAIRRRQVRTHRRYLVAAASLVVAFLVAYVFKVAFLGRESLAAWSALDRGVLYSHKQFAIIRMQRGNSWLANGIWRKRVTARIAIWFDAMKAIFSDIPDITPGICHGASHDAIPQHLEMIIAVDTAKAAFQLGIDKTTGDGHTTMHVMINCAPCATIQLFGIQ